MKLKEKITLSICKLLPYKGRRTIFLTSIFMKLNDIKYYNIKPMEEFNDRLKIVEDVKAFKTPFFLYHFVFDKIDLPIRVSGNKIWYLSEKDVHWASKRIVNENPLIKKKDNIFELQEDVEKILMYSLESHYKNIKKNVNFEKGNVEPQNSNLQQHAY